MMFHASIGLLPLLLQACSANEITDNSIDAWWNEYDYWYYESSDQTWNSWDASDTSELILSTVNWAQPSAYFEVEWQYEIDFQGTSGYWAGFTIYNGADRTRCHGYWFGVRRRSAGGHRVTMSRLDGFQNWTDLQDVDFSYADWQWDTMKVEVTNGNHFVVKINGVTYITYTDNSRSWSVLDNGRNAGYVALYSDAIIATVVPSLTVTGTRQSVVGMSTGSSCTAVVSNPTPPPTDPPTTKRPTKSPTTKNPTKQPTVSPTERPTAKPTSAGPGDIACGEYMEGQRVGGEEVRLLYIADAKYNQLILESCKSHHDTTLRLYDENGLLLKVADDENNFALAPCTGGHEYAGDIATDRNSYIINPGDQFTFGITGHTTADHGYYYVQLICIPFFPTPPPTASPTSVPSPAPTKRPTQSPTDSPSRPPTTPGPTVVAGDPSRSPTLRPTVSPTRTPITSFPTEPPTATDEPTTSSVPTLSPSSPSVPPTRSPLDEGETHPPTVPPTTSIDDGSGANGNGNEDTDTDTNTDGNDTDSNGNLNTNASDSDSSFLDTFSTRTLVLVTLALGLCILCFVVIAICYKCCGCCGLAAGGTERKERIPDEHELAMVNGPGQPGGGMGPYPGFAGPLNGHNAMGGGGGGNGMVADLNAVLPPPPGVMHYDNDVQNIALPDTSSDEDDELNAAAGKDIPTKMTIVEGEGVQRAPLTVEGAANGANGRETNGAAADCDLNHNWYNPNNNNHAGYNQVYNQGAPNNNQAPGAFIQPQQQQYNYYGGGDGNYPQSRPQKQPPRRRPPPPPQQAPPGWLARQISPDNDDHESMYRNDDPILESKVTNSGHAPQMPSNTSNLFNFSGSNW